MSENIISSYELAAGIDPVNDLFLIEQHSSDSYKSMNRDVLLGVSGQPADLSSAQAFTNKTLDNTNTITSLDNLFTLQDNSDPTKQAQFQLSGITTATTRTYTLPNASSTLADISTAQTLTNKTLTSPVITGGSIANPTLTVDSISGFSSGSTVAVAGLTITSGVLQTSNSVVANAIAAGAVIPTKLASGAPSTWVWQTWAPSWTGLTVGNGTLNYALYTQIGKTIFFNFKFTLGSSSAVTGPVQVSYPVSPNTTPTGVSSQFTGNVAFFNDGTTRVIGRAYGSTSTIVLAAVSTSGSYPTQTNLSATVPFTWATDYAFAASGVYEAA